MAPPAVGLAVPAVTPSVCRQRGTGGMDRAGGMGGVGNGGNAGIGGTAGLFAMAVPGHVAAPTAGSVAAAGVVGLWQRWGRGAVALVSGDINAGNGGLRRVRRWRGLVVPAVW